MQRCWPTKVLNQKHADIEHFSVTRVYRVFSIVEDIPRLNFLFGISIKGVYKAQPDLYNFRTNHTTTNNKYNESETHLESNLDTDDIQEQEMKKYENENQDTETQNIQTNNKPDQKQNKQTQAVKQNKQLEVKQQHTDNQDNIKTSKIHKPRTQNTNSNEKYWTISQLKLTRRN